MTQQPIMMPFVHRKSTQDSHLSDIENSRLRQRHAWYKFNNRRNTTRIQHYFQLLHDKRIIITYNLAAIILCIIGIWVQVLLIQKYFNQSYQKQSNSIMNLFFGTLFEHTIHTLRDPTFFSDFFPGYFTNPYKYQLSAETAPIYAQGFLIAYQYTDGYVTSWKAGDRNGKLIGIEYNENEPNISYLQFCNGTGQPTYSWYSSYAQINSSYPFEGGTETSSEDVIKSDWFVAGCNASGPLISELYIKRVDDTFIPQYTLVFPAIDLNTSTTDFVFSFDLTLQKVQHFLRTINVSSNSRLAVTTNENILIAVTGEDQPIDAFNNEIVTKEISELVDPVWSCVSKEDAFLAQSNFTTECSILVSDKDSDERNATIVYYVYRSFVNIGRATTWQFIAVLENTLEDEHPHTANIQVTNTRTLKWTKNITTPFVIGIVISVVGWFILIVLYSFTPYILRIVDKKNRSRNNYLKLGKLKSKSTPKKIKMDILHLFGWMNSNHARPTGVLNAISNLKIIQDSHGEDEKAEAIAKKVIFEIRENSFGCPTFNDVEFFSKIDNPHVRNKLKQMFGNDFYFHGEYDDNNNYDVFDYNDFEIMKKRKGSFSLQHPAFDATSLSILNSHNSKIHSTTNFNSKSSEDSEKLEGDLFQAKRDDEGNETTFDPIQQIVSIISLTNNYFTESEFDNFTKKILSDIPAEYMFITANSFFFTDHLFKLQLELASTLFDPDMRLSLYIAELAFQNAMKERRNGIDLGNNNYSSKIMNQIFLKDVKIVMKKARSLLFDLYKSRSNDSIEFDSRIKNVVVSISNYSNDNKSDKMEDNYIDDTETENLNNNNESNNNDYDETTSNINNYDNNIDIDLRWTKICEFTFEILQSTPLSSHIEIITKSQLFLTSKLLEMKLTKSESMILLKLLYISSMVSFLFDEKDSQIGCSALGINEVDDNDDIAIMNCLYENLIYPEMSAINQIFGSKYICYSRKH